MLQPQIIWPSSSLTFHWKNPFHNGDILQPVQFCPKWILDDEITFICLHFITKKCKSILQQILSGGVPGLPPQWHRKVLNERATCKARLILWQVRNLHSPENGISYHIKKQWLMSFRCAYLCSLKRGRGKIGDCG